MGQYTIRLGRITKGQGYFYISVATGLLLIFAAAMKWRSPIENGFLGPNLLTKSWISTSAIVIEAILGIWLISGLFAKIAQFVAILCFSAFFCVALYDKYAGAASCGCFGDLRIHPIYTAALDAVIIAALVILSPHDFHGIQCEKPVLLVPLAGGIIIIAGTVILLTTHAIVPGREIDDSNQLIVMAPETWIGKPLPILKYIDQQNELSRGKWIVIIYRHDCPACQKEIPKYLRLAKQNKSLPTADKVAFIEMPPYGRIGELIPTDSPCLQGKLGNSHEWFVETPLSIRMDNSIVTETSLAGE